jgi:hypothetical protein
MDSGGKKAYRANPLIRGQLDRDQKEKEQGENE